SAYCYRSSLCHSSFFLITLPPSTTTLFPYTTLFRSNLSPIALSALLLAGFLAGAQLSKIAPLVDWYQAEIGLTLVETDFRLVPRSEEHTSELQSRENLVCRLLLEKKNLFAYYTTRRF